MGSDTTIRVLSYTGPVQALLKRGKRVHSHDDRMLPECDYFWVFDEPISQYLGSLTIRGNRIYSSREMVARIEEHSPKHT